MSDLKIYISTFGIPLKKKWEGIPIEVGADLRDNYIYNLKDSTGDSISKENPYMAEMTGLYWIWKNVKLNDCDIVGFYHYNKRLRISSSKIKKLFKKNQYERLWIVKKGVKAIAHDYPDDIDVIKEILYEKYPRYYKSWVNLYNCDGSSDLRVCNAANMFVTSKEEFEKYCDWIFPIMFELKKRVGDVEEREKYHKRYCAFIAERLLSVYIKTQNCKKIEVEIDYGENYFRYIMRVLVSMLPDRILKKIPFQNKGKSSYRLEEE
ncbi:MAG: DUF4422 domain-containing protein [Pseudobutyrivibrio ruminis]|uniref:DUF4422 domain-containing protein n=1 Tax=Pseudobutyrivibrio ruminis TaxID=46206 RepID=UPI0026F1E534|nr:DUF4422 domain-containing protein [Pseudobutyrivibrio ruminis]MBE5912922.1 DUF4422 domain-containing protein [Pseudobutyrivibrio ruminis]